MIIAIEMEKDEYIQDIFWGRTQWDLLIDRKWKKRERNQD